VFFIINSLRLQGIYSLRAYYELISRVPTEQVARALSDALTANTGVTVVFESAVVPKWRDSRLSFKNVYISRRPGDPGSTTKAKRDPHAAHKAAVGYDVSTHPAYHGIEDDEHEHEHEDAEDDTHDEANYSRFDFTVDSIDVTLSLWKWLDGKGLVKDATIKGVRGVFGKTRSSFVENST
jgi:distribution and morphology protein 31